MAHHDLLVFGGVGMLALACLVVCGIYVYWISERHRNRLRRIEPRTASAGHINEEDDLLSGDDTTMGTQLSHRCKTSLYRAVFGNLHDESTVFLIAASRDDARKAANEPLAAIP